MPLTDDELKQHVDVLTAKHDDQYGERIAVYCRHHEDGFWSIHPEKTKQQAILEMHDFIDYMIQRDRCSANEIQHCRNCGEPPINCECDDIDRDMGFYEEDKA